MPVINENARPAFLSAAVGRMADQHTPENPVQSVNSRTGDSEYVRALDSPYTVSVCLSICKISL
jgi:hypothetical protein